MFRHFRFVEKNLFLSGHDVNILMVFNFSEIEKGISCTHAENPFSRSYDRKAICNSRVSFLMLRQAHSLPYCGDWYISLLNSGLKTNDIFQVFKSKNQRFVAFCRNNLRSGIFRLNLSDKLVRIDKVRNRNPNLLSLSSASDTGKINQLNSAKGFVNYPKTA